MGDLKPASNVRLRLCTDVSVKNINVLPAPSVDETVSSLCSLLLHAPLPLYLGALPRMDEVGARF